MIYFTLPSVKRSTPTFDQGLLGTFCGMRGSLGCSIWNELHVPQAETQSLMAADIPGLYIISLAATIFGLVGGMFIPGPLFVIGQNETWKTHTDKLWRKLILGNPSVHIYYMITKNET